MSLPSSTAIMSTQKIEVVNQKPFYYVSKPKVNLTRRSLRTISLDSNFNNTRCNHVHSPTQYQQHPYPLYPTLNKIRQHFFPSQQCQQVYYFPNLSHFESSICNVNSNSEICRVLKTNNITVVNGIANEEANTNNNIKSSTSKPNKTVEGKEVTTKIGKAEKIKKRRRKSRKYIERRQNSNDKINVKNVKADDVKKEVKVGQKEAVSVDVIDVRKATNFLNTGYSPPILPIPTYEEALDMWHFPTAAYLEYVYAYSKLIK
ncbi:uncharacterized protein LOC123698625 [Colias croceus]|uniref:uncharacterized protein LOC123698625 n=1 Tax=Colias crocea TaxID=72248 RepID=UPI001E27F95D|nr:uncharacterized protein LOC123698625 [Colias croceus]